MKERVISFLPSVSFSTVELAEMEKASNQAVKRPHLHLQKGMFTKKQQQPKNVFVY